MTKSKKLTAAAFSVGVLVLLGGLSNAACRRARTTPSPSPSSHGSEAAPSDAPASTIPAPPPNASGDEGRLALVAETGPSASSASRALASLDSDDARMMAQVERVLGGEPPPIFRSLVDERRRGGSREALESRIRASLASDLRLLRIAMQWLDEVFPVPGSETTSGLPSEHGLGAGGSSRSVHPIEPTERSPRTTGP